MSESCVIFLKETVSPKLPILEVTSSTVLLPKISTDTFCTLKLIPDATLSPLPSRPTPPPSSTVDC